MAPAASSLTASSSAAGRSKRWAQIGVKKRWNESLPTIPKNFSLKRRVSAMDARDSARRPSSASHTEVHPEAVPSPE